MTNTTDQKFEQHPLKGRKSNNAGPRRPLKDTEIELIQDFFEKRIERENGLKKYRDTALRDYTIFMFALYTGLRINEILKLKVGEVFKYATVNTNISVYQSKTHQTAQLSVQEELKEILTDYLSHYNLMDKKDGYLFPNWAGNKLQERRASKIFNNTFKGCGLDGSLGCHSARKTFAKNVMEISGNSIPDVQAALNHKNMATTYLYVKTLDKQRVNDDIIMKISYKRSK